MTTMKFGDRLKQLLEEKGLSQQDFAFDIRMDPAVLSKLISGKRTPTDHLIQKLASHPSGLIDARSLRLWKALDDYPELRHLLEPFANVPFDTLGDALQDELRARGLKP